MQSVGVIWDIAVPCISNIWVLRQDTDHRDPSNNTEKLSSWATNYKLGVIGSYRNDDQQARDDPKLEKSFIFLADPDLLLHFPNSSRLEGFINISY